MDKEAINVNGFAVVPRVLDQSTVMRLRQQLAELPRSSDVKHRGQSSFGIRNLLSVAPFVRELADSIAVRAVVEPLLGTQAQVVRGIFFDKTPEANWKVAWHQDLAIAVRRKRQLQDFTCWTLKAGVTHVQPPAFVLENMIAVRLHLDDADEASGALRVIPGSHRNGRLSADGVAQIKQKIRPVTCQVESGGALLMRPLLLHSSSAARTITHCRVIHLEFSSIDLPGGLEWHCS